jgi:hypothetical protein
MVVAKLKLAMAETGFSNCQHALEFLDALWNRLGEDDSAHTENGGNRGWIAFAREWTGSGKTFLVF